MTNFEKQLHTIGQSISLTSEEKRKVYATVKRYMTMQPIRQGYSQWLAGALFRNPVGAFFAVILLLGSGVSFAAEGALPGSLLYPVKVSLNEEVRGALALSPEAKAQWETKRVERRLAEAVTLSVSGKLDMQNQTEIKSQFEKQAEKVSERVSEFKNQNPELAREVNSRFETTLDVHEEVLAHIPPSNSNNSNTDDIVNTIREKRGRGVAEAVTMTVSLNDSTLIEAKTSMAMHETETKPEISTDTISLKVRKSAAERIRKEAKLEIADIEKLLKEIEKNLTPETVEQVKTDLLAIHASLKDAEIEFEMEEYDDAFSQFQAVLNSTYRLDILLRIEQKHGINAFSPAKFDIDF